MAKVKTVDFDKARKRRQRSSSMKRVMVLTGIAVGIALLVLLNNFLVDEGITTRISDLIDGYGGYGYPVPLPGGVIRDVKNTGDNLAVLNDTNLYVYTKKGKMINSVQKMTDNSVLLAGNSRLLTFDPGAARFAIHSRSKTILERETEFGMLTADINARGDYVIATGSKQKACEVRAFNSKNEPLYICYFADHQISSLSIAPKGSMMAAGYISAKDGVILSGVNLYHFGNDREPMATVTLPGEMLLDVTFYEEDRIGILTDRQYMLAGTSGEVKGGYSFEGKSLVGYEQHGRKLLFLCEQKESRTRELVLLGEDCVVEQVFTTGDKIVDMALGARRIYLLTEDAILTYDHNFALMDSEPLHFISTIHLVGDTLYYLSRENICILGQDEPTAWDLLAGGESEAEGEEPDAVPVEEENPEVESASEQATEEPAAEPDVQSSAEDQPSREEEA